MKRSGNVFIRAISLVLVTALFLSVFPLGIHAQEIAKSIPVVLGKETYYVDFRLVGDTLYCPADQWARAADCLWKFNPDQKKVYLYDHYGDSIAIFTDFDDQEYITDGAVSWIPFFEAAKQSGVFFTDVKNETVYGYRGKPLAVFYKDMDRMFRISRYRISSLINSLGSAWMVASSAARSYAILSTMSISGFLDAASGKMDQELYDDIFIELLKTDDSLLGTFADLSKEISRPGEVVSLLQKSLDEDGVVTEVLQEMGFSESEIREIVWVLAQDVYGDKTLNDLADYYEAVKVTDLLKILKIVDDMATTVEADAHTIMAMQEVFSGSGNARIRSAASKAVELRLGSGTKAVGNYSFEYLDEMLSDIVVEKLEKSIEEGWDVANWEKLGAKILVWIYDEALSLTDKTDAIMYAEASSLIQLELADYYYEHCNDGAEDTGMVMHSVALLYLRSCLASWKKFGFDGTLSDSIDNASRILSGEIANLMEYTETELRQNGTSVECQQDITELVRRKLTTAEPEGFPPVENNSHLYQDAMAAYAQLLQNGVMLYTAGKDSVAASHYQLLDIDGDGVPELVTFAVEEYVALFRVYTYRDGSVQLIGDSLNTCGISQWYNASHDLYICDGNRLYAGADKSTVAYTSGVWGFLEYDGRNMWYAEGGLDGAVVTEKLIDNSTIVGGIQIGSESDTLAKPEEPEEIPTPPIQEEPEEYPQPPTEEEPEGEYGGESSVQYDRPADGTYYYSMAQFGCYDSEAFYVRLRGPMEDYQTFLHSDFPSGPIGISYQHNEGYEVYRVEYCLAYTYGDDNEYVIYTCSVDDSDTSYRYDIEESGYVSVSDESGNLGTGYGLKLCWFAQNQLEIADDCVFADERLINSPNRIEMSLDAFMNTVDEECVYVWSYVEVDVTIKDGKVVELVLSYIP